MCAVLNSQSVTAVLAQQRACCCMRAKRLCRTTIARVCPRIKIASTRYKCLQVRTLNRVAMTHPMAVTNCNIDMESLIGDANRSIATLAITTLLKTGALAGHGFCCDVI